jgi:hypothetical protein
MTQVNLPAAVAVAGTEKCPFCGDKHKEKKEKALPPATFSRDDDALTSAGRTFIKGDTIRSQYYPKDEDGNWVSPLAAADWDAETTFSTYMAGGKKRARAEKYQPPPIKGWIAAPHHMVAICCMNGTNKLPGKPKANPWAKKGSYDINNGGNCIFLPSSASQFFVAYYLSRVRQTGRPLQGHLGAHRKEYFQEVWSRLERMVRLLKAEKLCDETESEADKDEIAKVVVEELQLLQGTLFLQLAARAPQKAFMLGAKTYIEIPDDSVDMKIVRAKIQPFLQQGYETLPKWY